MHHASSYLILVFASCLLPPTSFISSLQTSTPTSKSIGLNLLDDCRLSTGIRTLDPLPWNDYFTQELYLKVSRPTESVIYHAYIIPPTAKGPLMVTHHGAGSSGLSFALFASQVRKALPNAGVLSLDARGHGETVVEQSDSQTTHLDLSLETLTQDLLDVIEMTQTQMAWPELPGLVLIGHSLGGAVVTNVAVNGKLGNAVLGYAVLDVVEGMVLGDVIFYLVLMVDLPMIQDLQLMHCKACSLICPLDRGLSPPSPLVSNGSKYSSTSIVASCQHKRTDSRKCTLPHNP